jgi:hypothetical protein
VSVFVLMCGMCCSDGWDKPLADGDPSVKAKMVGLLYGVRMVLQCTEVWRRDKDITLSETVSVGYFLQHRCNCRTCSSKGIVCVSVCDCDMRFNRCVNLS